MQLGVKRCKVCDKILHSKNKSMLCDKHYYAKWNKEHKMNANYCKGRRKEYAIIHRERAKGRLAFRSAGSHSPIDVVSIDTANKVIRLIQSKPDDMSNAAKSNIERAGAAFNGVYVVEFSVV